MSKESETQRDAARRTASTGRRHSSSRETILRIIEAHGEAISLPALVRRSGLHENTVRGHLAHLMNDGYVTREPAPVEGRGRPAWLWRAREDAAAAPYASLARVLAETVARVSTDPVADARSAGRHWGGELAGQAAEHASGPRDTLLAVMREAGFDPAEAGSRVTLRRCPLIEAAREEPAIVCAVHQGMIDGVLAAAGRADSAQLEPFTPDGACTLHLRIA